MLPSHVHTLLLSVLPSLFQCYLKSTLALTLAKCHLLLNSTFVDRFIAPAPLTTTTKEGSPTFKIQPPAIFMYCMTVLTAETHETVLGGKKSDKDL